jgi:hypothetical protein
MEMRPAYEGRDPSEKAVQNVGATRISISISGSNIITSKSDYHTLREMLEAKVPHAQVLGNPGSPAK